MVALLKVLDLIYFGFCNVALEAVVNLKRMASQAATILASFAWFPTTMSTLLDLTVYR